MSDGGNKSDKSTGAFCPSEISSHPVMWMCADNPNVEVTCKLLHLASPITKKDTMHSEPQDFRGNVVSPHLDVLLWPIHQVT